MTMETETHAPALQALREFGSAIGHDGSSIEEVRDALDCIAGAIEGGHGSGWWIEQWRDALGICHNGGGHWTRHCRSSCGGQ